MGSKNNITTNEGGKTTVVQAKFVGAIGDGAKSTVAAAGDGAKGTVVIVNDRKSGR